jgi:hypothetical protein
MGHHVDCLVRGRIDKHLVCPQTGELVDRDHNAARNLRDWPETPVDAQLMRRPRSSAVAAVVPQTAARTIGTTDRLGSLCKTVPTGRLLAVRPKPDSGNGDKELRKESA